MTNTAESLAWNLITELRKELVESQKIRTQIIGFKIAFVSSVIGLVAAHLDKVPAYLLVLAPFAAVFFDLLITSYSFSIKRIGYYIRSYIEPQLKHQTSWPSSSPLWEEFMANPINKQHMSFWGNFDITVISTAVGIAGLLMTPDSQLATELKFGLVIILLIFIAVALTKGRQQFVFDKP